MRDTPNMANWSAMTWNLHGSKGLDIPACVAVIAAEAPDIVALQEVRQRQAHELAKRLAMRYTWVFKHAPYSRLVWWRSEGMAIMTPHLLDAAGHCEVSDPQPKRSWRRRVAQWALISRADRSMVMMYNLHLSPHDDPTSRHREARRVRNIVDKIGDDPPPVVAGDFNDADDPIVINILPGVEHVTPPPTNPADLPRQILDHILAPESARDVTVAVPHGGATWAALSDHLPVTIRFTL